MKARTSTVYYVAFLFCLLTAPGGLVNAQDERKFQLYTAAEGLSDDNITAIAQDEHRYLWVATNRGLNRYDGKGFIQYRAGNGASDLPDESIYHMMWLDRYRLGVYTGMGMHIINTLNNETHDLIIPSPDPKYLYKFNRLRAALSDERGNIYILTRSGFYKYDASYQLVSRFDYYKREEIATADFDFGENAYWISPLEILLSTINGAYIYDTRTGQLNSMKEKDGFLSQLGGHKPTICRQAGLWNFIFIKEKTDSILYVDFKKNRKVSSATKFADLGEEFNWRSNLFRLNDSTFYLTSRKRGFFKMHLNRTTGKIVLDTMRYMPSYVCTGFVIGKKDKRLWVATTVGLLKEMTYATSVTQICIPVEITKQFPRITIRQLFGWKDKLYAACSGDGGLLVFDKHSLAFLARITLKVDDATSDDIFSIAQGRDDTLYLGTNGPLFWLKGGTMRKGKVNLEGWQEKRYWITNQFKDSDGNLWVATNDPGVLYELPAGGSRFVQIASTAGIFNKLETIYMLTEDRQKNLWVAGHGISQLDKTRREPELYIDSFPHIRFARREVSALEFDRSNRLWAGIHNNGLVSYGLERKAWRHYTTDEGLADNEVKALRPLGNKLWIATAAGIASLDLMTDRVSRFSSDDGFPSLPVTSSSFLYDSSTRHLYCGFTSRITRFNPDSLLYTEPPPSFFIESIHFLNDTTYYYPGETITVSHRNNDMAVRVGSINYNDVGNQRISYRITGEEANDAPWQVLTGDLINFNDLPPGKYRVQLWLYAANHRWSSQFKEITIVITPPFWQESWFIVLLSLLLVLAIYLIYRARINTVRRTERAKVQVQELKAEGYKDKLELEKISHYFSSSLSGKNSVKEVLWDVVDNLIGRLGYEDCMIYMWNAEKTKMIQLAGYGQKGTPEALANNLFDVATGQGVVGYVMEMKEPVLIKDTMKDVRYRPDDVFRRSEVCVPIIHNGELMGVIDSENHAPEYFKERDIKILTTIATLVGNKIVQVESEQSLEVKRGELATINQQLAEAQLTALQTQMNPHFIFNALNSIKRMILDNENRSASRYLSKFAQMIRLTLNHSKETFVTLQETIEYLHAYLDMEQLRFGSSFSYTIETIGKPDEDEINIPTLMIQPLVENAIWHGLMHCTGEKKITIRFIQDSDMVTCSIQDNGIGILQSQKMQRVTKQPHVGLENLRNRIKIMNEKYDMNCTLEITDLSESELTGTGTLVILRFKIVTW